MERKLASVQTVKTVDPITAPDGSAARIERITFENIGWQTVAKVGEFKPGDKAVYIEISSILPEHPVFEFMRSKHFKVKTARFLGVLSQGLALPVSILREFYPVVEDGVTSYTWVDGADLTNIIGVTRPEEPLDVRINGSGGFKPFPTDIVPKTDEIRLQSAPFLLDEMTKLATEVVATVKLDGTSATFFYDAEKGEFVACGRNVQKLPGDGSVYWMVLDECPALQHFLKTHPFMAVQGEICGPSIQKNRLNLKRPQFFAFNLWNMHEAEYVPAVSMFNLFTQYEVPMVPIWDAWYSATFANFTLDDLLELAKGKYFGTNNEREGLVFRPWDVEGFSFKAGGRISFKVINNDYLLKGGE